MCPTATCHVPLAQRGALNFRSLCVYGQAWQLVDAILANAKFLILKFKGSLWEPGLLSGHTTAKVLGLLPENMKGAAQRFPGRCMR